MQSELNAIKRNADDAIVILAKRYPSLGPLIEDYGDTEDFLTTPALDTWIDQSNPIERTPREGRDPKDYE